MLTSAENIVQAFNCLFQCYWIFNADYEKNLSKFYEFVENYFYEFSSDKSFGSAAAEKVKISLDLFKNPHEE